MVDGTLDATGQTGTETLDVTGNVSGAGTVSAGTAGAAAVTVGGDVSVGTFNGGAGAVSITGGVSSTDFVGDAGTIDIDGDVTVTNFTESSTQTNLAGATVSFTTFTANGGLVVFDRVGTTNLTSGGAYNDVTVSAGTTVALQNDMTVGGVLTVAGTLTTGTNSLSAGSAVVDGTLDATGQTGTETLDVTGNVSGAGTVSAGTAGAAAGTPRRSISRTRRLRT